MLCGPDGELPDKLRNLEPRLIEHVSNEIMDRDPNVRWDDIGDLDASCCIMKIPLSYYSLPRILLIRLFSCTSWSRAC